MIALCALTVLMPPLLCAATPIKPPRHGNTYIVAHRGAHEGIPENTLPAYQKAIDLGVDFVEIDVRTTKDGQFVSMHNDDVDSYVTGAKGPVRDFTLAELKAMDVGSRIGPEWKGTQIPTFDEILDLCKGKVGIYLDLKAAPIEALVEKIKQRGMERDVLWYIGAGAVPKLHAACPECVEMPDPGPEIFLPNLLTTVKPRVVASVWKFLSKTFVERCHAAGAIVIVDDKGPDCWAQALEWGADGLQTDSPAKLIQFIEQKNPKK